MLLVDDDDRFREQMAKALRARGLHVVTASNPRDAFANLHAADLAALDLRMGRESGLDLLAKIKAHKPDARIILLTGYGSIATATEAMRLGAHHYLTKPIDADDLLVAFAKGITPPPPSNDVPSLARVEWEHINRVLADCGGNISHAARLLRIERRSLQRKLAKYPPAN